MAEQRVTRLTLRESFDCRLTLLPISNLVCVWAAVGRRLWTQVLPKDRGWLARSQAASAGVATMCAFAPPRCFWQARRGIQTPKYWMILAKPSIPMLGIRPPFAPVWKLRWAPVGAKSMAKPAG